MAVELQGWNTDICIFESRFHFDKVTSVPNFLFFPADFLKCPLLFSLGKQCCFIGSKNQMEQKPIPIYKICRSKKVTPDSFFYLANKYLYYISHFNLYFEFFYIASPTTSSGNHLYEKAKTTYIEIGCDNNLANLIVLCLPFRIVQACQTCDIT